jgi:hypothetical protein
MILCGMLDLCRIIFGIVVDLFRPRAALEAEMFVLRQQIIVLRRGRPSRVPFLVVDRMVLSWVCQLFPKAREALAIVRPDTVVRWHRAGFRCYWRWKSRPRPGRPAVPAEIRQLIQQMSVANPLWGAPRIHGELLKLGIDIGQTSVAKYMARRRGPPSQGWKTFLRNHADGVAAMDLFVVPTISFRLGNGRRQILWLGVTAHPTAEWIANQLTAACGWEQIPRDLIRDRDAVSVVLIAHTWRPLVMPKGHPGDEFLQKLCDQLHDKFEIAHPTVQIELADTGVCKLAPEHVV